MLKPTNGPTADGRNTSNRRRQLGVAGSHTRNLQIETTLQVSHTRTCKSKAHCWFCQQIPQNQVCLVLRAHPAGSFSSSSVGVCSESGTAVSPKRALRRASLQPTCTTSCTAAVAAPSIVRRRRAPHMAGPSLCSVKMSFSHSDHAFFLCLPVSNVKPSAKPGTNGSKEQTTGGRITLPVSDFETGDPSCLRRFEVCFDRRR